MEFTKLECGETGNGAYEILVTLKGSSVDELLNEFYETLADYLRVPAGTPVDEIEKKAHEELPEKYFRELRRDFVTNHITAEILKQKGLQPVLTPQIHVLEYPEAGKDFDIELAIFTRPKVSLTSYDPVEVEYDLDEASVEVVSTQVANIMDSYTTYEEIEPHIVHTGDIIRLDITTSKGDKIDPVMSGMGVVLDTEGRTMPKPIIDGLLGMKVGEEKKIDFTLPRPRGISANDVERYISNVKVLAQLRKIEVDLTDEWVAENYDKVSTVQEFLEEARKDVEYDVKKKNRETIAHLANVVLEKRLQGEIPDAFYQSSYKQQMDKLENELKQMGKTFEDYYEEHESNEQELSMHMLVKAGENLRQSFALEELFDGRDDLELTDDDLKNAHLQLFRKPLDDVAELSTNGKLSVVESAAKRIKALTWLVDTATVVPETK